MVVRSPPTVRVLSRVAGLAAALSSACTDPYRLSYVLTDEAVVMGLSLSVVEDGPHASELAPLPADRPRAEVLPLDTVELDALVVDIDGPRGLDDAAWVLCGDPCLASLEAQGQRYGVLEPCVEDSAVRSFACLAGRGARPRVMMPAVISNPDRPRVAGAYAFLRVVVIVGSSGGPTTDECVQQLVEGPVRDLWGCAVGVRELPYGPPWALLELAEELENQGIDSRELEQLLLELGVFEGLPQLPALVTQLLPPNAAPRIEAVEVSLAPPGLVTELESEIYSIDETIEVEAAAEVWITPVISPRDQQLVLDQRGLDSWVGRYEGVSIQAWAEAPVGRGLGFFSGFGSVLQVDTSEVEGPLRIYAVVTDEREGVSWFTFELEVVAR